MPDPRVMGPEPGTRSPGSLAHLPSYRGRGQLSLRRRGASLACWLWKWAHWSPGRAGKYPGLGSAPGPVKPARPLFQRDSRLQIPGEQAACTVGPLWGAFQAAATAEPCLGAAQGSYRFSKHHRQPHTALSWERRAQPATDLWVKSKKGETLSRSSLDSQGLGNNWEAQHLLCIGPEGSRELCLFLLSWLFVFCNTGD